jgi:hypothetical protein
MGILLLVEMPYLWWIPVSNASSTNIAINCGVNFFVYNNNNNLRIPLFALRFLGSPALLKCTKHVKLREVETNT